MSKTVIEMAREAGLLYHIPFPKDSHVAVALHGFANLVRADERAKLAEQPAQQERPSFAEWTTSHVRDNLHKLKPAQPAVQQHSTCNNTLLAQGKAYPRTCRQCGLGPCAEIAHAHNGKENT